MTKHQARDFARSAVKREVRIYEYARLSMDEARLMVEELITAAAQLGCWTYLADHVAVLNKVILMRSRNVG